MRISLIDNGLDSLKKGYAFLEMYEHLVADSAKDSDRFSALKDSVLSIQHGIEILFKYVLKDHNELLIFSDISKLKDAFKRRRKGIIAELYEADGVHTVTFKESIERLRDICGLNMGEGFKEVLLKVEGWRNSITHSAVLLKENDVSRTLLQLLHALDEFLGPIIGKPYLEGQGRTELDRTYRLTKAVYGELEDKIKAVTIERLISSLQRNGIRNVTAPGVFFIDNAKKAYSVLRDLEGGGVKYGCDLINGHCSGNASVAELKEDGLVAIYADDNRAIYQFDLDSIVVYVPEIQDSVSPLIFMYSKALEATGSSPYLTQEEDCVLQYGVVLHDDGVEFWGREDYQQFLKNSDSESPKLPPYTEIIRFLSYGPVCFMNVQGLEFGSAHSLLDRQVYGSGNILFKAFQREFSGK